MIKCQLAFHDGPGAVAAEAILGFVASDIATKRRFKTRRWIEHISHGPIQAVDRAIVADATFVELSAMAQYVSFGHVRIAKDISYGFTDSLVAIAYTIGTLV